MPRHVTTPDGVRIACEASGDGPPLVLVHGAGSARWSFDAVRPHLERTFTVIAIDRRGRGDSGDTQPYAIEREVEDIAAVIEAAGGSANLYGTSSGAALAMHAAAAGAPVTRLAMWEPPYNVNGRPDLPDDTASVYRELVESGRRGDAAEYFMAKVVGLPPEFVANARQAPWWAQQEAIAHTLAYDATVMGDYTIPTAIATAVPVPTIVIDGGASFGFLAETADALAKLIPDARRATLEGQEHNVDPAVLAPVLTRFFTG